MTVKLETMQDLIDRVKELDTAVNEAGDRAMLLQEQLDEARNEIEALRKEYRAAWKRLVDEMGLTHDGRFF